MTRDDSEHGVDESETVLVNPPKYKVNDERLCRSTQWVVSLNTALSTEFLNGNPRQRVQPHIGLTDPSRPSTLIRLTSRSHISLGFPFGICIEKEWMKGCII